MLLVLLCSVIGRDLEQEFRDRLTAVRSQVEQESDVLLQQVEQERSVLQEELWLLRAQEAALQEELCAAVQVSLLPGLSVWLPSYLSSCLLSLVSEFVLITNRCLIDLTSRLGTGNASKLIACRNSMKKSS